MSQFCRFDGMSIYVMDAKVWPGEYVHAHNHRFSCEQERTGLDRYTVAQPLSVGESLPSRVRWESLVPPGWSEEEWDEHLDAVLS